MLSRLWFWRRKKWTKLYIFSLYKLYCVRFIILGLWYCLIIVKFRGLAGQSHPPRAERIFSWYLFSNWGCGGKTFLWHSCWFKCSAVCLYGCSSVSVFVSVCLSVWQTVWVFPAGLLAVSLSVVMLASLSVKLFTLHTTRSVWPTMCFSIRVSVRLSVHLSPHLSVYLPHGLFVCPSIPLSICLYACSPACRSIHIPLCLSMLSASPSFELSVYLLVCRRIND